jgi:hypothetical protein
MVSGRELAMLPIPMKATALPPCWNLLSQNDQTFMRFRRNSHQPSSCDHRGVTFAKELLIAMQSVICSPDNLEACSIIAGICFIDQSDV